uniref:Uncharacterized protein n=1 Tax=Arundo donax TaxID=35708 RepID=A0A0A9BJW2_ARUDO
MQESICHESQVQLRTDKQSSTEKLKNKKVAVSSPLNMSV